MPRRTASLDVGAIISGIQDTGEDKVSAVLLDATVELLGSFGIRRWSLEDVALRSGVGRATVYRRFEGRDDLVQAALARETRRFFSAIADAVAGIGSVEEKVVEGLLVGLRAARHSFVSRLVATDPDSAVALLTAEPVLDVARSSLLEQYLSLLPDGVVPDPGTPVVAEALVRLAISFVLMPRSVVDLEDEEAARASLRRLILPLLRPA